jgi:hypothetical protein
MRYSSNYPCVAMACAFVTSYEQRNAWMGLLKQGSTPTGAPSFCLAESFKCMLMESSMWRKFGKFALVAMFSFLQTHQQEH